MVANLNFYFFKNKKKWREEDLVLQRRDQESEQSMDLQIRAESDPGSLLKLYLQLEQVREVRQGLSLLRLPLGKLRQHYEEITQQLY